MPTTVVDSPLSPSPYQDRPGAGTGRRRWQAWRSPQGQPPWARPVLLGIAAVAALLFALNITQAGLAPFYSVAVKSMSESWKAFFYGAFDPQATITIDKLAGSFLPQALSAVRGQPGWAASAGAAGRPAEMRPLRMPSGTSPAATAPGRARGAPGGRPRAAPGGSAAPVRQAAG